MGMIEIMKKATLYLGGGVLMVLTGLVLLASLVLTLAAGAVMLVLWALWYCLTGRTDAFKTMAPHAQRPRIFPGPVR